MLTVPESALEERRSTLMAGEVIPLCAAADVVEGQIRPELLPDGTLVALYNVDGRIYATDDVCTHGAASLSEDGTMNGHLVECGWHYGSFDVTTGEPCASPCSVPLRTYPIMIVDGVVQLQLADRPMAGPAIA